MECLHRSVFIGNVQGKQENLIDLYDPSRQANYPCDISLCLGRYERTDTQINLTCKVSRYIKVIFRTLKKKTHIHFGNSRKSMQLHELKDILKETAIHVYANK